MKRLTLEQAITMYENFGKNFYWLRVMVKENLITESEAGFILYTVK